VPAATGALAGVRGVNSDGGVVQSLQNEYELCFRCHGDSANRGPARVDRQFVETNTRQEFNPANISFHPVVAVGKNASVPSLIPPWSAAGLIYCGDCHNNDQGPGVGGTGPKGPHGSAYTPLLERQLLLTDNILYNVDNFALCFKCHSSTSILSDQSFRAVNALGVDRGHRFHVVDQKAACTTCHDSHASNKEHLINFNTSYVSLYNGVREYNSTGPNLGNCTLTCHSFDHDKTSYPTLNAASAAKALRRTWK
jgi:predicted CXXCH cytochrome family protein